MKELIGQIYGIRLDGNIKFAVQKTSDIPDGYVKPEGTKNITTNGIHDVTEYASAEVNVPSVTVPKYDGTITVA